MMTVIRISRRMAGTGAAALLLGAAVAAAITRLGSPEPVSVRAGAGRPDPAGENAITTTTSSVAPITVPATVPLPSLTVSTARRPPATVRAVTTTAAPKANPCGDGWGYGDLGGSHTTTVGTVTVLIAVYPCPAYDADHPLQFAVDVRGPDAVVHVHLDYGDGQAYDLDGQWGCDPKRPDPWHLNPPTHDYPAGTYHVVATVGTAECDPTTTGRPAVADQTTTVGIDAVRAAGSRPK